MQNDDMATSFGLVQIGRAQQDREPFILDEMKNDVPELAPRQRIDANRRLVEQYELGRAHEGAGEAELLLHAAGQPASQAPGEGCERSHFQETRILTRALGCLDAVQVSVEIEVLRDAQILVEAESLWHVADAVLDCLRLCYHVEVQHLERAGIRRHESGHQAN